MRLLRGDFSTVEQVAADPAETARSFEADGAKWIHMVDLDGALEGKRVNSAIFAAVAHETGLQVEVGGGIRSMEDIAFYVEQGVSRVILGSAALKDPAFVRAAVASYAEQVAVGIDAKNGYVAAEGWLETSQVHFIDFAKQMEALGVQTIIYTDIAKDGTLAGPNLEHFEQLQSAVSCQLIASGGVTTLDDIHALRDLGLYGAICGKSIYKGTLSLREAVASCR